MAIRFDFADAPAGAPTAGEHTADLVALTTITRALGSVARHRPHTLLQLHGVSKAFATRSSFAS